MTPIFIISFNQYTNLKRLIDRLIELKQERLIVIDNKSTYEPLLQYYEEIEGIVEIIWMEKNYGHNVLKGLYQDPEFMKTYQLNSVNYVYTDCDIVPVEECPADFVERLNTILAKYHRIPKVGLGLKIDDLPECFKAKARTIKWESQFWERKVYDQEFKIDLFDAAIDTTFACQRANTSPGWTNHSFRTGKPYLARHLPWYVNTEHLTEEEIYYTQVAKKSETHFPDRR